MLVMNKQQPPQQQLIVDDDVAASTGTDSSTTTAVPNSTNGTCGPLSSSETQVAAIDEALKNVALGRTRPAGRSCPPRTGGMIA